MCREKPEEEEQESRDVGAGPAPLASLRRWLAVQIAPELLEEAERDPLTGLNNRRADHREVTKVMEARAAVPNCTDRLVRFRADVDNFKALNDTHGHQVGDRALILIGRVLLSSVRMGEDVVSPARVGGDEFAITLVLSPRTAPERIRDRLERNVSNALRREGLHRAGVTEVGVSIGFAIASSGTSLAVLDAAADEDTRLRKRRAGRSRMRARRKGERLLRFQTGDKNGAPDEGHSSARADPPGGVPTSGSGGRSGRRQ